MKRILGILILIFSGFATGSAQDLFETGFPKIGDSIYYMTDQLPSSLELDLSKGNDFWDLRTIQAPYAERFAFKDPTKGMYFHLYPDADLLMVGPDGKENYWSTGESKVEEIGFFGLDPIFKFSNKSVRYTIKPVRFQDVFRRLSKSKQRRNEFRIYYSINEIPANVVEELPEETDSLMIIASEISTAQYMGQGVVLLPDRQADIFCIRDVRQINYAAEIKLRSIWAEMNISNRNMMNILLKSRRTHHFIFFEEGSAYPIAEIITDDMDQPINAKYKPDRESRFILRSNLKNQDVVAYPNPTFGDIRFKLINYPEGEYKLEIYNIIGKKLWSSNLQMDKSGIIQVNLGELRKGTYLYSFFDSEQKKLSTKKLVIIKP